MRRQSSNNIFHFFLKLCLSFGSTSTTSLAILHCNFVLTLLIEIFTLANVNISCSILDFYKLQSSKNKQVKSKAKYNYSLLTYHYSNHINVQLLEKHTQYSLNIDQPKVILKI